MVEGSKPLKSTRQEKYCQLFCCGMSQANAYEDAGYDSKTPDTHAEQLMRNSGVKVRIGYLQAKTAEKHEITREGQASKLDVSYVMAMAQGNSTGMTGSVVAQNRLYGLDKQVIETDTHKPLTASEAEQAREYAAFKRWQANEARGQVGGGEDNRGHTLPFREPA